MMSHHLNSMLEHLRVGRDALKRIKVPNESDDSGQAKQQQHDEGEQSSAASDVISRSGSTGNAAKGNGTVLTSSDEIDNSHVSVVINDTRKKSLKEIPNGVLGIIDAEKKFDPRKRYSVGNGDLRLNGRARELSPATMKPPQRKLSADMRVKGSNSQLADDYLLRRPVRLKSVSTNFEVYDSLHTKSMDVSTHSNSISSFVLRT